MFKRLWGVLAPLAVFVGSSCPALAGVEIVLKLGPENLTAGFAKFIAQNGVLNAHTLSEKTKLGDLVKQTCGTTHSSYFDALRAANQRISNRIGIDKDSTLPKDTEILLPPCIPQLRVVYPPTVIAGLNPELGFLDPEIKPRWMRFKLNTGTATNAIPSLEWTKKVAAVAGVTIEQIDNPEQFVHFTDVGSGTCSSTGPDRTFDDDVARINDLIRTLIFNKLILKEKFRLELHQTRARIIIIDSGVYLSSKPPFRRSVGAWDEELTAFGVTALAGLDVRQEPYDDMPSNKNHGTMVAALALGGPALTDLVYALGFQPQLISTNAYGLQESELLVDRAGRVVINPQTNLPQRVSKYFLDKIVILDALSAAKSGIVNLSMGRQTEIQVLKSRKDDNSGPLFVVAAGNRMGGGQDLRQHPIYPARYGGGSTSAIVTVGAIDASGAYAPFANYSSEFVDIAALGCDALSVKFDREQKRYVRVRASGTSFSTPKVSHVAALIRTSAPSALDSGRLKLRLLAGSDIRRSLVDKVIDGRVLNPNKALSIYSDLIELSLDGAKGPKKSRLVRGFITSKRDVSAFCKTPPTLPLNHKLLKVIPRFDGTASKTTKTMIYWHDHEHKLFKSSCEPATDDIVFQEHLTGKTFQPKLSEVNDIVFSMVSRQWGTFD